MGVWYEKGTIMRSVPTIPASSWVEPAVPLEPKRIRLSATDNLCAQVYPCAFWFFPSNDKMQDPLWHYERIKRGMARLFHEQPILAGTVVQDERGWFEVEIPASPHAGARIYYQDVSKDPSFPTMQQFIDAKYPIMDGQQDGMSRLRPEPFPMSQAGDPVFVSQLTRVKGGLVLFGTITHMIGDLIQPQIGLVAWATQTALVADAIVAGKPEPPLPTPLAAELYDRSRLLPSHEGELEFSEIDKRLAGIVDMFPFDPTDIETSRKKLDSIIPPAYVSPKDESREEYLRNVTGGIWMVRFDNLKRLQATVQAYSPDFRITTTEALFGLCWQRFWLAKYGIDRSNSDFEKLVEQANTPAMCFPVDIRGYLDPPLPTQYMGAAVALFKAPAEKEDFVPKDMSSVEDMGFAVAHAARAIRGSMLAFTEDKYMEFLRLVQQTPRHVPFFPTGPLDILITDHTRNFPLRYAKWGHGLGVASGMRQPYFGRSIPAGEATLLPRFENGDIELMLTAERGVLERFLNDPVVNSFMTNEFISYNVPETLCPPNLQPPTPRL